MHGDEKRLASKAAVVIQQSATGTRLRAHGFPAFPSDEGNNHQSHDRVSPRKVPNRVDSKANQSDQGKVSARTFVGDESYQTRPKKTE